MTDINRISKEVEKIILENHIYTDGAMDKDVFVVIPYKKVITLLATWLLECVPETREVDGKNIGNPYFLGFNACKAELLRRLSGENK